MAITKSVIFFLYEKQYQSNVKNLLEGLFKITFSYFKLKI